MSGCCENCDFARYTPIEGKVGCAYWSTKYYKENGENTSEEKRNSDMFHSGIGAAWLGWVYLQRRPEKEISEYLGEGIMTNFCVISKGNDSCNKFEERK